MTNKKYLYAGITGNPGNLKPRFTNNLSRRVKICSGRLEHGRVDFVELPSEMNKIDALNYLLTLPEFSSPEDQATLSEYLAVRMREANRGELRVPGRVGRPRKNAVVTTVSEDKVDVEA